MVASFVLVEEGLDLDTSRMALRRSLHEISVSGWSASVGRIDMLYPHRHRTWQTPRSPLVSCIGRQRSSLHLLFLKSKDMNAGSESPSRRPMKATKAKRTALDYTQEAQGCASPGFLAG